MQRVDEDRPMGNNKDSEKYFASTEKNNESKNSQNKKNPREIDIDDDFTEFCSLLKALEPLQPPPMCKTCYAYGYGRTCMVTDAIKPREAGSKRSAASKSTLKKKELEPELMRKKFKTGYVPEKFIPIDQSLRDKFVKKKKKPEGRTIENEKPISGGIISNSAALGAPSSSQGLERSNVETQQLWNKGFPNGVLKEDRKITEQNEMSLALQPLNLAKKDFATPQPNPDGFLKYDEIDEARKQSMRTDPLLLENILVEDRIAAAKELEAIRSANEKSNMYQCHPPLQGILLSGSSLTVRKRKNVRYVDGFKPGDDYYANGKFKVADNNYEQEEKRVVQFPKRFRGHWPGVFEPF